MPSTQRSAIADFPSGIGSACRIPPARVIRRSPPSFAFQMNRSLRATPSPGPVKRVTRRRFPSGIQRGE